MFDAISHIFCAPHHFFIFGEASLEVVEEQDVNAVDIGCQAFVEVTLCQALFEKLCHDVVDFDVIHIPVSHQHLERKIKKPFRSTKCGKKFSQIIYSHKT